MLRKSGRWVHIFGFLSGVFCFLLIYPAYDIFLSLNWHMGGDSMWVCRFLVPGLLLAVGLLLIHLGYAIRQLCDEAADRKGE